MRPNFHFVLRRVLRLLVPAFVILLACEAPLHAADPTITAISAGNAFSLILKSDGSLWAMGSNFYGQLGDGTTNDSLIPEQIIPSGVVAIAAGGGFSLFLKSDGSLWSMGANGIDQLGDGTGTDSHVPELIVASGVTAIAAGDSHSLFIKTDGSLWGMGQNAYGQLGDGTSNVVQPIPEQIVASGVTAIAAGEDHSLFLKNDGSLWGMGHNNVNQVSGSFMEYILSPVQVVDSGVTAITAADGFGLILKSDGSLWGQGNGLGDFGVGFSSSGLRQVVASGVTAIAAGGHADGLFLKSDGSLWGVGYNYYGQLGDGTTNDNISSPKQTVAGGVIAISAGGNKSLFLKSDGSLWGVGHNSHGQLGDGTTIDRAVPEQILPAIAPGITTQPTSATVVAGTKAAFNGVASGAPAPTYQWQISADNGTTWSNLTDGSGIYGSGTANLTIINPLSAVPANQFRLNASSIAGTVNTNTATLTVGPAGKLSVTNVAAAYDHTLFLKSDGSLWAMGYNFFGALGGVYPSDTDIYPEQIVDKNVTAISGGEYHSLFLKSDGSLWAMGGNGNGALGDGTTMDSHTPEQIVASGVVAAAAGWFHSLYLKSDGSLWGMGFNNDGQTGADFNHDKSIPVQVVAGDVTVISAGGYHSLFLKSDGSLWGMGLNSSGQLGNPSAGGSVPAEIVSSGVLAVAAGYDHSLFLKSDGSLWVMGSNDKGQLGDGTTTNRTVPVQMVGSGVTAIAAGYKHSLFLKSDGSLWAMGYNNFGQLGDGTTTNSLVPEQIISSGVTAITAGNEYSLFIKNDGSLWAMGTNSFGQLGNGPLGGYKSANQLYPVAPVIAVQPGYVGVVAGTEATFTASASGSPSPTFQWQVSTDGGSTWGNLSDNTMYAGSATGTLSVLTTATELLGEQYRSLITNYIGTTNTVSAPLVVGSSIAQLTWLQNNFTLSQLGNPGMVSNLATPAKDGIPNFIKYAFDLNPNVSGQAALPQPTLSNGNLVLTFPLPPADATYSVQVSTDLVNWSTAGVTVQTSGSLVTASYPLSGSAPVFMRIVISPAP